MTLKTLRPLTALAATLFASSLAAFGQTNSATAPVKLPAKEKLQIYLLIGQSNMAGRGDLGPEDTTPQPRVLMFTTENKWAPAVEPITHDKPKILGVGPGFAFGKVMAEHNPDVTIGLISCAFGGTPLKRWEKGGDLYSNAVVRTKIALRDGTLKGILWHQGESDSGSTNSAYTYGARLAGMIQALRADLDAPNVPFVAGELGEYLYDRGPDKSPYARDVNRAITNLPAHVPMTASASSKGFKAKSDGLHFTAESQREFGKRYAAEMIRLQSVK